MLETDRLMNDILDSDDALRLLRKLAYIEALSFMARPIECPSLMLSE